MTISLGEGKIEFTGPELLSKWTPLYRAGVYAIFTEGSAEGKYLVLYVGESENLSERGFIDSHHAAPCWKRNARTNLYIGVHLMPESTADKRRALETVLRNYYNPVCNKE